MGPGSALVVDRTLHASSESEVKEHAHYRTIAGDAARLEGEERELWQLLHGNDVLDGPLLFSEVEAKAHSEQATAEDKAHLRLLQQLREKKVILLNVREQTSRHILQSEILPEAAPPTQSSLNGTRFWAVIVGIDRYDLDTTPDLRGACADATMFHDYLARDLAVPPDHIRLLLSGHAPDPSASGAHATREGIISALHDLRDNPDIQEEDNIIFYFAGRGTRYTLSRSTSGYQGVLDALCPADRGCEAADGPVIDISERETLSILHGLGEAKGTNITVILDCSYPLQTSQGRGDNFGRSVRSAAPLNVSIERMLSAANDDAHRKGPSGAGGGKVSGPDWDWDDRSCVLLTSCLGDELARETKIDSEEEWHGCFTRALIGVLRAGGERTYAGLGEAAMEYMPCLGTRPVQHPMVIGARKDEGVWYRPSKRSGNANSASRRGRRGLCVIF